MTSMHRKWSAKVHVPSYGGSSSVAECLSWNTGPKKTEIKVEDDDQQRVTFVNTPQMIGTARVHSRASARTPTLYKSQTRTPQLMTGRTRNPQLVTGRIETPQDIPGEPPIYGFDDEDYLRYAPEDNGQYRYMRSPSPYTFQDHYPKTEEWRKTPSRNDSGQNFYDAYSEARKAIYGEQNLDAYDPDKEEEIRDHLVRQQLQSYDRQIDAERIRLQTERENEYQSHIRRSVTPGYLNEKAVIASVRDHSKYTPPVVAMGDMKVSSGKPPIPKPPGMKKPSHSKPGYPRHTEVHRKPSNRSKRTNCWSTSKQVNVGKYKPNNPSHLNGALSTKRVNFNMPRPNSASMIGKNQKSGHFFQWRDHENESSGSKHSGCRKDGGLWKMPRFANSAKARINTGWTTDPTVHSKLTNSDPNNQVQVGVKYVEGDNVDVAVSLSKSPDNKPLRFL